jgi:signal transduction histidine kinase
MFMPILTIALIVPELGECFKILARKRDVRVGSETANRQKDECVITVAHQLQKSTNVIAGWLELLQCEKLNQQDARRAIRSMNRSVKRQVKLIEELLDCSQNSNGKLRLSLRGIDALNDFKVFVDA